MTYLLNECSTWRKLYQIQWLDEVRKNATDGYNAKLFGVKLYVPITKVSWWTGQLDTTWSPATAKQSLSKAEPKRSIILRYGTAVGKFSHIAIGCSSRVRLMDEVSRMQHRMRFFFILKECKPRVEHINETTGWSFPCHGWMKNSGESSNWMQFHVSSVDEILKDCNIRRKS